MCLVVKGTELNFQRANVAIIAYKVVAYDPDLHEVFTPYRSSIVYGDEPTLALCAHNNRLIYDEKYDVSCIKWHDDDLNPYFEIDSGIIHLFKDKDDAEVEKLRLISLDASCKYYVISAKIPILALFVEGLYGDVECYGAKKVIYNKKDIHKIFMDNPKKSYVLDKC